MLAKKPYNECPYETMVRLGAPWLDDWKERVIDVINAYDKSIHAEAEYVGLKKLADEDFLYERFVDNIAAGMWYANWEVLKFFESFMRMKMFKEAIGDWTFTEHDVEMFRYFANVHVDKENKCKYKQLMFNSGFGVSEWDLLDKNVEHCVYFYYDNYYHTYRSDNFNWLLQRKSAQIRVMLDRCKMLSACQYYDGIYKDSIDYFSAKIQWPVYSGASFIDTAPDFSTIGGISFDQSVAW